MFQKRKTMNPPQHCKISQYFGYHILMEKQNKTKKVLYHFNWTNNLKMVKVCKMEAYIMVGRISVSQNLEPSIIS